ncbi:hypothetical protein GGR58DRAFT_170272 [Xylaria digitata]|nr:hypothetical protein GGR58DRAFT_170272 [Xylaria digitata]
MSSTIKKKVTKVADLIPGLRPRQNTMPEQVQPVPFQATDWFHHRYLEPKVLREALISIGFKDNDIKIKATEASGLDVQLPRQLTSGEKNSIYQKLVDAKFAQRGVPLESDDEDE